MTQRPIALVVDDEVGILTLIELELKAQGFDVMTATTGQEGLRLAEQRQPDIALLDILLPDMSGLEIMQALRERLNTPVLLVSAKDSDIDKVRGLEMGADDYVVKPFSPEELAERAWAVLRRNTLPEEARKTLHIGNVEIDLSRRLVRRAKSIVSLTRTEWLLLQSLALNAGKVIENSQLLTHVWGPEYSNEVEYLGVWVTRLRQKLESDSSHPAIIKTERGIGYFLEVEAATPEASRSG
jgi:two-component system KDP operon response regulator KdpE